ncbi:choice-of-anchor P family protein [Aeromicrobium terrae]|uniref:Uncharacterized protein n=1 Tax=Aeromicrobium terrae TaxID=2498846 RepID=A0A5C8NG23_9ACTN|nr:choice-of-anchor P family protein [Aeromicrobium terrae]TXL60854.1 hypothetical protein FHP06_10555 [Aeromicrobium terrae]
MKRHRIIIGAITGLLTAASIGITGVPASAYEDDSTGWRFQGSAAGSTVRAFNNNVTSGLTAESSLDTEYYRTSTNGLGRVVVPGLLDVSALSTSVKSSPVYGNSQVQSKSRATGVKLLGGAITADAVDVSSTAKVNDGWLSAGSETTFTNLKIGWRRYPVNVAPNTKIRIAGLAEVVLNYQDSSEDEESAEANAAGIKVTLLKPQGESGVGATIKVAPTSARVSPGEYSTLAPFFGGGAYGSKVTAQVGNLLGIKSDPTAPVIMPGNGTDDEFLINSVGLVNVTPVSVIGAVMNTARARFANEVEPLWAQTTSRVTGVSLLNGRIRADVIASGALATDSDEAGFSMQGDATITDLVINRRKIRIPQGPNTVYRIPGIATVTVNEQIRPNPRSIIVRALHVRLLKAYGGFPAGADIEVAVSKLNVGFTLQLPPGGLD